MDNGVTVYNYMDTIFCCMVEKNKWCEEMVSEHMFVYICSGEIVFSSKPGNRNRNLSNRKPGKLPFKKITRDKIRIFNGKSDLVEHEVLITRSCTLQVSHRTEERFVPARLHGRL